MLHLQCVEKRLVGAATEFLFELFTLISFRAHEALGSEITAGALEVGHAPSDLSVAAWNYRDDEIASGTENSTGDARKLLVLHRVR